MNEVTSGASEKSAEELQRENAALKNENERLKKALTDLKPLIALAKGQLQRSERQLAEIL